jgi:hypothetical protein
LAFDLGIEESNHEKKLEDQNIKKEKKKKSLKM